MSSAMPPRPHRGMSLMERFRAEDSYGLLLVLIVASLFVSGLPLGTFGSFLRASITGVAFLFALKTSQVSRGALIAALVVVVAAAVLSLPFEHDSRMDRIVVYGGHLLLTAGVLAAIARRVGTHPAVSGATIAAALCVYLLLGLGYSSTYGVVGAIDPGPGLKGTNTVGGDGSTVILTYFSFTTLTTVGFGDIVANTDAMRMIVVTEAFTGQIYLVTIVALLVGNLGRQRRGPPPAPGPD